MNKYVRMVLTILYVAIRKEKQNDLERLVLNR